jgi:hypothetical protein
MLAGRPAEKRTTSAVDAKPGASETFGKDLVAKRDDFVAARVDIAVHVSNEVPDTGSLGKIAWHDHQDVFVGRAHDVRGFRVVVQELTGMKDRPRRQFERKHDTIRRFDQTSHAPSIGRIHGERDQPQPGRRFPVRVQRANRDGRRRRGHIAA